MASIKLYVHSKDLPTPDGLCPNCNLPSLKVYVLQEISMDGITILGERVACKDESKWVSPLKVYSSHD